jgi:hypothetical protein
MGGAIWPGSLALGSAIDRCALKSGSQKPIDYAYGQRMMQTDTVKSHFIVLDDQLHETGCVEEVLTQLVECVPSAAASILPHKRAPAPPIHAVPPSYPQAQMWNSGHKRYYNFHIRFLHV